jgi:pimeloyl-ACP methyl ester carboxylesterase
MGADPGQEVLKELAMTSSRRDVLSAGLIAATAGLVSHTAAAEEATSACDPQPLAPNPPPPPITAQATVAKLADVDLWYWDSGGEGQAVVLLHPATGSGLIWGYQQSAFAAAGYRVIGYSRRGFNGSSPVDPANPGSGANDLRLLLDHLHIDRAHVLGTAAGGFIAASFALAWPRRVESLTLACTILSGAERTVMEMLPSLREPWYNALPHEFRELSPSYRAIDMAGVQRWHELHARSRGNNPAVNQPAGEPATLAALARLTMPVLLISGDADLISPPPVARLFHRTIRGSELVVFPECGHSAYWERPDDFNLAVLRFIGSHRGARD